MRYYSTQRPVAPGTYPRRGAQKIMNFDCRAQVELIGRQAWGYIEYDRDLTEKEAKDYELVRAGEEERR